MGFGGVPHGPVLARPAPQVLMWDLAQDTVVNEYLNCFQRRCAELDLRKVVPPDEEPGADKPAR